MSLEASSTRVQAAIRSARQGLIEREALTELIALGAVAGEHVLVIGPPGTAKSEAVRRVASALGAHTFEYLLGRFTEPSEIFGPIDLQKLRDGTVEVRTEGMLPEAELAFLDEVFLGSTAILNTLLGILAERSYRRGHTQQKVPLRVCVGASNELPTNHELAAFADRFLLRTFVEPVPSSLLEDLLEGGWSLRAPSQAVATVEDIDRLASAARQADLSEVRGAIAHAVRLLREAGIVLSDRRAVKTQKLVAAAAVLAGRERPTTADLWPLVYAVPTADGQELARTVLKDWLVSSESTALSHAAADASLGPAARAQRLVEQTKGLVEGLTSPLDEVTRTRVEAVLREIDAGFSERTEALSALRARLQTALQA